MDLKQLEYFSKVCKWNSFTQAAAELRVSQPSITNSIQKLEEELGVKLLERSTKKVSLTVEGELFYKRVLHILGNIETAVSEVKNTQLNIVKFGLPPLIGSKLFPNIFLEFNHAYPEVHLELFEEGSRRIRELLDEEQLELGFIILEDESDTLHTLPLTVQQMKVCLPPSHRLATEKQISFEQLSKEKFITLTEKYVQHHVLQHECSKYGFTPDIIFATDFVETAKALVSQGVGVTLLMDMVVDDHEQIVKIPLEPPMNINIGLAWKKGVPLSPPCNNMIKFIHQLLLVEETRT